MAAEFLSVGGFRLRVMRHGEGPPALLIMGLGGAIETWEPLQRQLPHSELIMVDHPGMGLSSIPSFPIPMRDLAQMYVGVLDRLGYERADLVGYSFGGAVAQELTLQDGHRVERLVLMATACGWGGVPGRPEALAAAGMPLRLYSRPLRELLAPYLYAGRVGRQPLLLRDELRCIGSRRASLRGVACQIIAYAAWTSLPWLHTISHPTLVMGGEEDPLAPVENARIIAARIPNARLHVVRGGGHLFPFDSPLETGLVIRTFLRQPRQPLAA